MPLYVLEKYTKFLIKLQSNKKFFPL